MSPTGSRREVPEHPPTVPQGVIDFIYDAPDFIALDIHHITLVGDFGYAATLEVTHDDCSQDFASGYEFLGPSLSVSDGFTDSEIEYEEVAEVEQDRDTLAELEDLVAPNSNEEDRVVPNGDQAPGSSVNNAINAFGSDEDDSLPDPAQDLDMRMVARLNRNTFVLDTRSFCPMCRSTRHRELNVDNRKPRTECRHSTFKLWGYHMLRQDWHLNFTPGEKIIQLGHTILHCAGIRSQLVMEWNDCVHTPDIELTDEDALAMATTMVHDQLISSALQNLLNVTAMNAGRRKGGAAFELLDYDVEYMLD